MLIPWLIIVDATSSLLIDSFSLCVIPYRSNFSAIHRRDCECHAKSQAPAEPASVDEAHLGGSGYQDPAEEQRDSTAQQTPFAPNIGHGDTSEERTLINELKVYFLINFLHVN
jgi:hypothetical protein